MLRACGEFVAVLWGPLGKLPGLSFLPTSSKQLVAAGVKSSRAFSDFYAPLFKLFAQTFNSHFKEFKRAYARFPQNLMQLELRESLYK